LKRPVANVSAPYAVVSQIGAAQAVVDDIAAVDLDHGVRRAPECNEEGGGGGDIRVRQTLSE
jgi:hypothetical protein